MDSILELGCEMEGLQYDCAISPHESGLKDRRHPMHTYPHKIENGEGEVLNDKFKDAPEPIMETYAGAPHSARALAEGRN